MLQILRSPALCLALCAAAALTSQASAQEAFPSRSVTLVVPAAPGGLTDIIGRATAPALARALGQAVVVVNRTGAGGAVGSAAVAKGPADGYNLLVGITSLVTLPAQEIINNRPPAFRVEELTPIASLSTEPMMLITRPDAAYRSLKDVFDDARKRPGAVNYSTTGVYGTYHVAVEMVAHAADVRLVAIHYQGGGGAMRALLGKEVDLSLITRSVGLKRIQSGQLRPLAAWGPKRWEQLPDVPSLKDEGFDLGGDLVTGLFVATGTPGPVTKVLREAVRAAVNDEQFKATMAKLSAPITYLDGPGFEKLWKSEAVRLGTVVEKIGRIQ